MKVGEHEIEKGARVSARVRWRDGRETTADGTLITVQGEHAYVDTALGAVEVDVDTVEPVEGA